MIYSNITKLDINVGGQHLNVCREMISPSEGRERISNMTCLSALGQNKLITGMRLLQVRAAIDSKGL